MKIWHVTHSSLEFVVFDFGSILLSVDYDSDEDDEYDFENASYLKISFAFSKFADRNDITDVFWDYVPSGQKSFVKQNLIKTTFN